MKTTLSILFAITLMSNLSFSKDKVYLLKGDCAVTHNPEPKIVEKTVIKDRTTDHSIKAVVGISKNSATNYMKHKDDRYLDQNYLYGANYDRYIDFMSSGVGYLRNKSKSLEIYTISIGVNW